MRLFGLATAFVGLCAPAAPAQWQRQAIGTTADFRGLCAVGPGGAWVGGENGTYGRTTDAGRT